MLIGPTGAVFVFLLSILGVCVPVILIASRTKGARKRAIALILTASLAGCVAAVAGFLRQSPPLMDLSLAAPFPFSLAIDRLSAFFLLLVCAVAVPVTIFAVPYFDLHYSEQRRNWTWAFFSLFLLSMIVVVTAVTGFAFLAGWELMTLVSAALILIEGDSGERRHNVFIYLLMMHAGAAAVATCFFLFLPYSHSLDFGAIRAAGMAIPGSIPPAIFLGVGTSLLFLAHHALPGAALALVASLLHAFNHALFKSLLFLGAGAISHATHSVNLNGLGGLQRRMPLTGLGVLVGCCSIAGLPFFNGFISEWLTFRSFLAGSSLFNTKAQIILPLMVGILALIGGVAAACFVQTFGVAFLGRPRSMEAEQAQEVPLGMRVALLLLGTGCIGIGILPGLMLRPLVSLVQMIIPGAGVPEETLSIARIMPWIAAIVFGTGAVIALFKRRERLARTWACGLPGLSSRMQYTSTVFSKPIRFVFARVYRPDRKVETLPTDQPYFPVSISYQSVRTTSYERALYRPFVDLIVSLAHRLRRLQTGNIQVYLLYIFLALVTLLAFLRFQR